MCARLLARYADRESSGLRPLEVSPMRTNLMWILAMCLGSLPGICAGQEGFSTTVSVATLLVPVKARTELGRAERAVMAGRLDEVDRDLAKALQLDRNFGEAYVLRGAREIEQRNFTAALADAYMAERLDRGLGWALVVQASALNGLRRFHESWTVLQRLQQPESNCWQAQFERTRAAVGTGDVISALSSSAQIMTIVPLASLDNATILRGDALEIAGRDAEAVATWKTYLASPRTQRYREQVQATIAKVVQRMDAQEVAILTAR